MNNEFLLSLYSSGQYQQACSCANELINASPRNHFAMEIAGLALLQLEQFDKALVLLNQAASLQPKNPDYQHNIAVACRGAEKYDEAVLRLKKLIKKNKRYAPAYNTLGTVYSALGDRDKAIRAFKKSLSLQPDLMDARFNLAREYNEAGEYDISLKHALSLYAANSDEDLKLLIVNNYLSIKDYKSAEKFSCGDTTLLLHVARHYESKSLLDQALAVLNYLPENKVSGEALLLKAIVHRRQGDVEQARICLECLHEDGGESLENKASLYYELGRIYDILGMYGRSIECYTEANSIEQSYSQSTANSDGFLGHVTSWISLLQATGYTDYPVLTDNEDEGETPLFMVGFPRSGTTLLDQVIDSHSGFSVMEEYPIIGEVIKEAIRLTGRKYPALLPCLDKKTVLHLRSFYHRQVNSRFKRAAGTTLVDKLPLNIVEVLLIHVLFPRARFVFSLRHPYDVCLSNFMQHFEDNAAMNNFRSLEGCAETYNKVMRLWNDYCAFIPGLMVHTVKYEALVDDLENESRKLFSFLGVEWEGKVLDFHRHAKTRKKLATPSYQQVTRPIYSSSKYRWKNYQRYIERPFSPIDGFVRQFGYDVVGE